MSIIELQKSDLAGLSDAQLEELVARLCEAEVAARGEKLRQVMWSGSITAPDGGVDVRVTIASGQFEGDFVPRPDTVFQIKAKTMQRASILNEMKIDDRPSSILRDLIANKGAYIIASNEDCSPLTYRRRVEAMQEAVQPLPETESLHIDFYDRSRLHLWLRQYPSVQLWLRMELGKPLSGWQAFGRWSATPAEVDDSLILEQGIFVNVPSAGKNDLELEEALPIVRRLILSSAKPVRIMGLSGVGKTRFVQALFEEDVSEGALDRSSVIYADIGDQPEPTAHAMIDNLLTQDTSLTVVLDNCASDLHNSLSTRLRAKSNSIRLITVEYDIREDKPQTTDVVQIVAKGPNIAEQLLLRRHPKLGQLNAAKIAEFSEGNPRLALAIAESAPIDDSLSKLTDDQLFNRLFHQRHDLDAGLKEQAEALSLVYSFSVETDEEGVDELRLLGELCEQSRLRMHRAAQTLVERQIAQQRSRWRALLPHAVANRLATEALKKIPIETLIDVFERRGSRRLLKSFGRRLGYLHENHVAVEIVNRWLSEDGLLSDLTQLNEHGRELFSHVAPVSPERVLDLIERSLSDAEVLKRFKPWDTFRQISINLLVGLAYYPEYFDRAVEVLMRVAEYEGTDNNYDSVVNKLEGLFQAYLSGTHASLEQRASKVRAWLFSSDLTRQAMGLILLNSALEARRWTGFNTFDFGARPRDYGYNPSFSERLDWLKRFMGIAFEAANSENPNLSKNARKLIANNFRSHWRYNDLRHDLSKIALALNDAAPWLEGWRTVRSILKFDYKNVSNDAEIKTTKKQLEELAAALSPKDLLSEIEALVIDGGGDVYVMDDDFDHEGPNNYSDALGRLAEKAIEFGEKVGANPSLLDQIAPRLVEGNHAPYRMAFGRGLIRGSTNPRNTWSTLLQAVHSLETRPLNHNILSGAIDELFKTDRLLVAKLLDEAASDDILRPLIVDLHPRTNFSDADFDRCMHVLKELDGQIHGFGVLLWRDETKNVELKKRINLAELILSKENGEIVFLEAITMLVHGKPSGKDVLGEELRKLALRAVAKRLTKDDLEPGGMGDYRLAEALNWCLPFDGCDEEKNIVLDALFDKQNGAVRHIYRYDSAVAKAVKHLTGPFFERALNDKDAQKLLRLHSYDGESHFANPLDLVSAQELVNVCRNAQDERIWELVANSIVVFTSPDSLGAVKLTEQALEILGAAPNPAKVLNAFIDIVEPMSWSGSKADIVAQRIDALSSIPNSQSGSLKEILDSALPRLRKIEKEEREHENNRDRENEQRFE